MSPDVLKRKVDALRARLGAIPAPIVYEGDVMDLARRVGFVIGEGLKPCASEQQMQQAIALVESLGLEDVLSPER
jgi:hypothetical protein